MLPKYYYPSFSSRVDPGSPLYYCYQKRSPTFFWGFHWVLTCFRISFNWSWASKAWDLWSFHLLPKWGHQREYHNSWRSHNFPTIWREPHTVSWSCVWDHLSRLWAPCQSLHHYFEWLWLLQWVWCWPKRYSECVFTIFLTLSCSTY